MTQQERESIYRDKKLALDEKYRQLTEDWQRAIEIMTNEAMETYRTELALIDKNILEAVKRENDMHCMYDMHRNNPVMAESAINNWYDARLNLKEVNIRENTNRQMASMRYGARKKEIGIQRTQFERTTAANYNAEKLALIKQYEVGEHVND